MARKSEFIEFKPAVFRCFDKGMSIGNVQRTFPDIPGGTLRTWRTRWGKEGGTDKAARLAQEEQAEFEAKRKRRVDVEPAKPEPVETKTVDITAVTLEVIKGGKERFTKPHAKLPTIDSPAFSIAEYTLKTLALSGENEMIKTQCAKALLDVVKIRAVIPAHVLEEEKTSTLETQVEDMASLEPADLARLYREAL
jgi:hypothetical protein